MMKPVVEKKFTYKGYDCAVLFQPMGFRTGYVRIPEKHPWFNKPYNELGVACHGGLTYGRPYLVNVSDESEGHYWIGFDCGHYGDANDYDTTTKLFMWNPNVTKNLLYSAMLDERYPTGGVVRSLKYCEGECKNIVDQLLHPLTVKESVEEIDKMLGVE